MGGNNIRPLEHLDKIDYPIYYLCDWDQHGLEIYERLYRIIEGVANKCSSLTLLTPNGKREKLKDTEEHHSSVWKAGVCFAGLTPATIFTGAAGIDFGFDSSGGVDRGGRE